MVGLSAAALPEPMVLLRVVGTVAGAFSTPLDDVWEMPLSDLREWADEANQLRRERHRAWQAGLG